MLSGNALARVVEGGSHPRDRGVSKFLYRRIGGGPLPTSPEKKKRKRRRRRAKLRYLRQRLAGTESSRERRRLIAKMKRISPGAPVPDA